MPVKWTPETDQILLLKILETSSINADVKAIAQAWPDSLDKPTPRAISERLVKIRHSAKSSGSTAHFSVSKGSPAGTATPAGTPKKRTVAPSNGVKKSTPSKKNGGLAAAAKGMPTKSKRGKNLYSDGSEDEGAAVFKVEDISSDDASDGGASYARNSGQDIAVKLEGRADVGAGADYGTGRASGFESGFGHDGAGEDDGAIFA